MKVSQEKQGELFVLGEVLLWSLFPVITILSMNKLPPLVSLGGSSLFAGFFFAIVITWKRKWHELIQITALKDILIATFFLGILYYILFFFGLQFTSAGNAAIIALTEIFFSYLFFNVWKKDHLPLLHKLGAILMLIGALIVLYPGLHEFRLGDLLILLAALIAPIGNFYLRRARISASSDSIMFIRSFLSAIVIFLIIIVMKTPFSIIDFNNSLLFLIINGVLLLGLSKALWIEGIHRIAIVKANALNSMAPLLTLLFAWLILKNIPTGWQLLSFIPMLFGIILLGINKKIN